MITAILTIWKRNNIHEQIDVLLNQTLVPEEIWIYHCGLIRVKKEILKKSKNISYQFNSNNLGYFGRFALALSAKTPYVLIMDDDVIPSANWLERSLNACSEKNSIICSSGRIIPPNDYRPESVKDMQYLSKYFIGDNNNYSSTNICSKDTLVDFGCNSWLIKKEWLNYFWSVKPHSYNTGEDIHLSATCILKGAIKSYCLRQDGHDCGNLKKYYGFDAMASWRNKDFLSEREKVFKYWIDECGWKPIEW